MHSNLKQADRWTQIQSDYLLRSWIWKKKNSHIKQMMKCYTASLFSYFSFPFYKKIPRGQFIWLQKQGGDLLVVHCVLSYQSYKVPWPSGDLFNRKKGHFQPCFMTPLDKDETRRCKCHRMKQRTELAYSCNHKDQVNKDQYQPQETASDTTGKATTNRLTSNNWKRKRH